VEAQWPVQGLVLNPRRVQDLNRDNVPCLRSIPDIPCLIALVLPSFRTIMEATVERKTAAQVMMLWKYKPLDQDDAL
jgi:hypothetical protein